MLIKDTWHIALYLNKPKEKKRNTLEKKQKHTQWKRTNIKTEKKLKKKNNQNLKKLKSETLYIFSKPFNDTSLPPYHISSLSPIAKVILRVDSG